MHTTRLLTIREEGAILGRGHPLGVPSSAILEDAVLSLRMAPQKDGRGSSAILGDAVLFLRMAPPAKDGTPQLRMALPLLRMAPLPPVDRMAHTRM